jgi:hypothetical protein
MSSSTNVGTSNDSWSSNKATSDVLKDGAIKVGSDDNVELGGCHHHLIDMLVPLARCGCHGTDLHAGVVDDHLLIADGGVFLSHHSAASKELSIRKLPISRWSVWAQIRGQREIVHDVGLVDGGDLLSPVLDGILEGEAGNTKRSRAGDDFQTLYNTRSYHVLQARVLALGVLANDDKVHVFVACLHAGDVLDGYYVGKQIDSTTDTHVS